MALPPFSFVVCVFVALYDIILSTFLYWKFACEASHMCFFEIPKSEIVELSKDGGYHRDSSDYRFWRCPFSETIVVRKDNALPELVSDVVSPIEAYCSNSVCRRVCECEAPSSLDDAPLVRRYVSHCWKE
jgi:hypothetical protein